MRLKALYSVFILSAHLVHAQASQAPGVVRSDNQKQVEALNAKVARLDKDLDDVRTTLTFYKYLIDEKQNKQDSVQLDPASHTYQRLDTDTGAFLIVLKDIAPYLNGYKVTLNIGNPSAATFRNVTVKMKWSKPYDWQHGTSEGYQAWEKAVHEQDTKLTDSLAPGSWNPAELILIPASSEELGYLEISLDIETVALGRGSE